MRNQSTPIISHHVALIKLKTMENPPAFIQKIAEDILNYLNLKVVEKTSHQFHPKGTTLAYILSESHLLIQSWPEIEVIHLDLVTCNLLTLDRFENSIHLAIPLSNVDFIKTKSVNYT